MFIYLYVRKCADERAHLGEIYLSHDSLGRLFVLLLLPHFLQSHIIAAQL